MTQSVQGANANNILSLETEAFKLASTLSKDLATLFADIAKDLGGKDKEGGHIEPKPVGHPPVGKPVAKLNLSNLDPSQRRYAELIAGDFAKAGYGRVQQAAAVANAIAESDLDPTAVGDDGHSIGLFQENRDGGLGTGHSVANLENPQTNIRIVLDAAERYSAFGHARTIDGAVSAFVDDVERPYNIPGQTAERERIAKQLLA